MPARRNRGNGGIAAIGVLIGIAVATAVAIGLSRPGPGPNPSISPTAAATGPVVFYEALDADGSLLMARPLDGRSLARVIARRPNLDYTRTWTVDPSGRVAIAQFDGSDGSRLEAIDTATGASHWVVDAPAVDLGIGLDLAPRDDGSGTDVRAWSLAGGSPRTMATFDSVDTVAFDPGGRLVAMGVGDTSVVVAGLDGQESPIWKGKGRGDLAWST